MDKVSPNGNKTYTAGGAIAKGDVLKFSDGKVIKTTAANDAAIGIALDGATEGDIVPVAILGNFTGTVQIKAAGAISAGVQVAANATATGAGTDVIIGRALEAATAANDMIEIAHCVGAVK